MVADNMKKTHFKKTSIKKIDRGDIFSFEKEGFFYYGRILTNHFLGLFSIIYKYKNNDLNLDIDFSSDDGIFPPIILDGYSLFQLKSDGDWGIIAKDPDYKIPDSLKNVVFSNINGVKQKKIKGYNIYGQEVEVYYEENETNIVDDVIYGDYDISEFLDQLGFVAQT